MRATSSRIALAAALACALAHSPLGAASGDVALALALPQAATLSAAATPSADPTPTTPPGAPAAPRSQAAPPVSIGPGSGSQGLMRLPPVAPRTVVIPPGLDDALDRIVKLQERIELARGDAHALEQRIAVANSRILGQQNAVDEARIEFDLSQSRFERRLVEMYKSGLASPLVLLLSARSLADFYARAIVLSRVIADDVESFRAAEAASREAEYAASVLDDLKAQLVDLRSLHDQRLADAKRDLAEERALVATLSQKSREFFVSLEAATELTRKQWRESSVPIGTPIPFATALCETDGATYVVSGYQPLRYTAVGEPFTAVCSWYGNEFNGRPSASGQIFNQDDLTCASRTLPFGTRIALERDGKRVIVIVTDRGPFIAGRDLDLSRAAARALGFSGVERVNATYVVPSDGTEGSSR